MFPNKDKPGRRKFAAGSKLRQERKCLIDEQPQLGSIPWHDPFDDHFVNVDPVEGALIERDWRLKKRRLKAGTIPCSMIASKGTRPKWFPAFTFDQTEWSLSRDPEVLQARFDEGEQLSKNELRLLFESSIGL